MPHTVDVLSELRGHDEAGLLAHGLCARISENAFRCRVPGGDPMLRVPFDNGQGRMLDVTPQPLL